MTEDGGAELDNDNGNGHMWVDWSFNLGIKSTSVHLAEPFILSHITKDLVGVTLPTLQGYGEDPMR